MSSNRHKKLAVFSFLSLITFLIGVILIVAYIAVFRTRGGNLANIIMWAGIVLDAIGFVSVLICIICYRHVERKDTQRKDEALDKFIDGTERKDKSESAKSSGKNQQTAEDIDASKVTYIANKEDYEFVVMGQYQTIDEKFNQIGKMDKTQFVIYISRLFSRKGFQVKFTPIMDNHDVDLLVEKMGVTIAVGCMLSSKVLSKDDVARVRDGGAYYGVSNTMALTNMYFDRDALEYAKAEHVSLVDRNILAEDFMV